MLDQLELRRTAHDPNKTTSGNGTSATFAGRRNHDVAETKSSKEDFLLAPGCGIRYSAPSSTAQASSIAGWMSLPLVLSYPGVGVVDVPNLPRRGHVAGVVPRLAWRDNEVIRRRRTSTGAEVTGCVVGWGWGGRSGEKVPDQLALLSGERG